MLKCGFSTKAYQATLSCSNCCPLKAPIPYAGVITEPTANSDWLKDPFKKRPDGCECQIWQLNYETQYIPFKYLVTDAEYQCSPPFPPIDFKRTAWFLSWELYFLISFDSQD